jgi:hypothetical protein
MGEGTMISYSKKAELWAVASIFDNFIVNKGFIEPQPPIKSRG